MNVEDESVLIVGTVRDCGKSLVSEIERLDIAFSSFSERYWFIVESDSSDDTVSVLQSLSAKDPRVRFITMGELSPDFPFRSDRLAYCRNRCLSEFFSEDHYKDTKFLVVADLDDTNVLLNKEAVDSCFVRSDWGACAANQLRWYYDIWALRHRYWSPNDCWKQVAFLESKGMKRQWAEKISVEGRMLNIPKEADWIEVSSAFGGLAIYRREYISKDAEYVGLGTDGQCTCEHISFNRGVIDQGGKIFINPRFINNDLNEHNERMLIRKRVRNFGKRVVKKILGR